MGDVIGRAALRDMGREPRAAANWRGRVLRGRARRARARRKLQRDKER